MTESVDKNRVSSPTPDATPEPQVKGANQRFGPAARYSLVTIGDDPARLLGASRLRYEILIREKKWKVVDVDHVGGLFPVGEGTHLAVMIAGEVVGTVTLNVYTRETAPDHLVEKYEWGPWFEADPDLRILLLSHLVVHPDHRGSGAAEEGLRPAAWIMGGAFKFAIEQRVKLAFWDATSKQAPYYRMVAGAREYMEYKRDAGPGIRIGMVMAPFDRDRLAALPDRSLSRIAGMLNVQHCSAGQELILQVSPREDELDPEGQTVAVATVTEFARTPFAGALPEDAVSAIEAMGDTLDLLDGGILENTDSHFHVVLKGILEGVVEDRVRAEYAPGEAVGIECWLYGTPASEELRARGHVRVFRINGAALHELLSEDSALKIRAYDYLLEVIFRRLADAATLVERPDDI